MIHADFAAGNPYIFNNPFVRQIRYFTLERAVDAGATDANQTYNYRTYGTTVALEHIYAPE